MIRNLIVFGNHSLPIFLNSPADYYYLIDKLVAFGVIIRPRFTTNRRLYVSCAEILGFGISLSEIRKLPPSSQSIT